MSVTVPSTRPEVDGWKTKNAYCELVSYQTPSFSIIDNGGHDKMRAVMLG